MPQIYKPAEDSHLMIEALSNRIQSLLEKNPDLKVLEMGCGSGIILSSLKDIGVRKENILGVDVNPKAVERCSDFGFNCVQSDLFQKVPKEKFGVIVFNPPYLPEDRREPEDSKLSTTGGTRGNEIIEKFLEEAKSFLAEGGRIYLITSSQAEDVDFDKFGFRSEKVREKKLFFERLVVWRLLALRARELNPR